MLRYLLNTKLLSNDCAVNSCYIGTPIFEGHLKIAVKKMILTANKYFVKV